MDDRPAGPARCPPWTPGRLLLHAGAGGTAAYAVGTVCFAVSQAGPAAVRQAVAVSAVAPAARVRARAAPAGGIVGWLGVGVVTAAASLILAVLLRSGRSPAAGR